MNEDIINVNLVRLNVASVLVSNNPNTHIYVGWEEHHGDHKVIIDEIVVGEVAEIYHQLIHLWVRG